MKNSGETHDIKAVTDVVDNAVVNKQPQPTSPAITAKSKTIKQHLCLERAYNSKAVEQETIKRGYVPHAPYKGKRDEEKAKDKVKTFQKDTIQECDGLLGEQTHDGTTGSGRRLYGMKRRQRTIWIGSAII
jgi:hypothetical protein